MKSNPTEWKREIIAVGGIREMYDLECEILQLIDARNDRRSFNKTNNSGFARVDKTGTKHSEETKKKMREASVKRSSWPLLSQEHKDKISQRLSGRIMTAEHKARIGLGYNTNPMFGENNSMFGKNHSEETKEKIRQKALLRKRDPKTTELIAAKLRGRKRPQPIVICPHCNKEGALMTMKRWHFDKCRNKNIS